MLGHSADAGQTLESKDDSSQGSCRDFEGNHDDNGNDLNGVLLELNKWMLMK